MRIMCCSYNQLVYLCVQPINIDQEEPTDSPTFEWISLGNITHLEKCRNSRQGSTLIVDELGQHNIFTLEFYTIPQGMI